MQLRSVCIKTLAVLMLLCVAALPAAAGPGKTAKAANKTVLQGTVNINKADAKQFALLPGVGPKTAESIVSFRGSAGAFKTVDDLLKVKGIGKKRLEKLRPYLSLEGETTLKKVKKS